MSGFQYEDQNWSEGEWKQIIERLINARLISWKDVATSSLGQMNPSQVGTSLASSDGFKLRYGKGNTMREVMAWFYDQNGKCIDCGSRFELQADHIIPKEIIQAAGMQLAEKGGVPPKKQLQIIVDIINTELVRNGDQNKVSQGLVNQLATEAVSVLSEDLDKNELRNRLAWIADCLENMGIRCRRCNVIRRPSHKYGGNTHLTAESALMWLLFTFKPRTLRDFIRMCRLYGMTMANIRMQEGWAMAHWLQHADGIYYELDSDKHECDILIWPDGAITRAWNGDPVNNGFKVLYKNRLPIEDLCIIAVDPGEKGHCISVFRMHVEELPFSHYFFGSEQPPQSLCITYSAPKRNGDNPEAAIIGLLPPRNMRIIANAIVGRERKINPWVSWGKEKYKLQIDSGSKRVKICDFKGDTSLLTAGLTP